MSRALRAGRERMEEREHAGEPPVDAPRPRPFRSLAPEHVVVETIVARIVAAVPTAGAAIGLTVAGLSGMSLPWWCALAGAGILLVVGLWVLAQRWPPLEHRYAGYRLGPDAFEIKRGVVWRSVASVPRARIQHTDVTQGPLQRGYDLATLVIYTAGTSYSKLELAGLRHAEALRVRDELLAADVPAAPADPETPDVAWIEAAAERPSSGEERDGPE